MQKVAFVFAWIILVVLSESIILESARRDVQRAQVPLIAQNV